MQITVFLDNLRPKESKKGIIYLAKFKNKINKIIFVTNEIDLYENLSQEIKSKSIFVPNKSYLKIFFYMFFSVITVNPSSWTFPLKIISNLSFKKKINLFFTPGKVTKAVGFFKHPERGKLPIFINYFKFILLNNYLLVSDNEEKEYLSASLGYPLKRIIISKHPKYFYINSKLNTRTNDKLGVLVAPTHRWENEIPPLTQLLKTEGFLSSLENKINIFHSKHPDTEYVELRKGVKKFEENWNEVHILLTDYSSIGEDFFYSGGKNLIFYIPDKKYFEANQGKGIFFDSTLTLGKHFSNIEDLENEVINIFNRNSLTENHRQEISLLDGDHYFEEVIKKI